jgi:hypothetical protein
MPDHTMKTRHHHPRKVAWDFWILHSDGKTKREGGRGRWLVFGATYSAYKMLLCGLHRACLFGLFVASGHQKLLWIIKHSAFQLASVKFV